MRYAGRAAMYTLTLAGPGKNALSSVLMESIITRLREASGEPVLLIGAGDAFSAGLDLQEVAGLDRAGAERFLGTLERMTEALFTYPAPMVACVNGHAIAGGCVVELCADYRVLADQPKLRIGLNEVALGVQFPPTVLAVVRHRVPPRGLERDVLVMDADVLCAPVLVERLVRSAHANCFLLDASQENTGEEQMLLVRDGRVRNIVRGGAPGFELMGESIGFLKLSAAAARLLRQLLERRVAAGDTGIEHEEVYPDLLAQAAVGFERVDGLPWIEIDFPDDVARAEREVLPQIDALDPPPGA